MNMWTRIGLVALIAAALTAPASAVTNTVIDDFTKGGFGGFSGPSTPVEPLAVTFEGFGSYPPIGYDYTYEWGLPTANVIGGVRKMELFLEGVNDIAAGNEGAAKIIASSGILDYSNDPGIDTRLVLTYDANAPLSPASGDNYNDNADPEMTSDSWDITNYSGNPFSTNVLDHNSYGDGLDNGSGFDLLAGNAQHIMIELLTSDLDGTATITVKDSDGTIGQLYDDDPQAFNNQGGILTFDFDDFVYIDQETGSGADSDINWAEIKWIQFEIDPVTDADLQFAILGAGTIPEPLTMLAVGSAMAGLGGYIRRRRRA